MVKGSLIQARKQAENCADIFTRMLWSSSGWWRPKHPDRNVVKVFSLFSSWYWRALYSSCNSQLRSPRCIPTCRFSTYVRTYLRTHMRIAFYYYTHVRTYALSHITPLSVCSGCAAHHCLSCALQRTTFLQPLTEKPRSNRGVYFGASTAPRLVKASKVRCMWRDTAMTASLSLSRPLTLYLCRLHMRMCVCTCVHISTVLSQWMHESE